jgi:hypothetical protein
VSRVRAWRRRLEVNNRVRWFWYGVTAIVVVCGLVAISIGILKIVLGLP